MASKPASELSPALTSEHFWHPMASPFITQKYPGLVIERGDGVDVWDNQGNRYFDAMAGLWCVNVGHNRPEMKKAIVNQLDELEFHNTFSGQLHPRVVELSGKLADVLAEDGMVRFFYGSGGSDACESAFKLARHFWVLQGQARKTKFIGLRDCYHGMHVGGTSITGSTESRNAFGALLPGCIHVDTPYLYRNPWTQDPAELGTLCADILEREIVQQGPETIAAFIAEPVIGVGGVIVPPENYWPRVREICDKYDILLIADEVVTGFGRSGAFTGSRGWGVKPDMMCLAKGMTSGYIPFGATAVNARVAEVMESAPPPQSMIFHGYTYSGHPLGCAAALASIDIAVKEDLAGNSKAVGDYLLDKLQDLNKYRHVGDVRGKGLMAVVEMVKDKASKEPLGHGNSYGMDIGIAVGKNGALVRAVGHLIILSPPLISTKENMDDLVAAMDAAFAEVPEVD